MNKQQIWVQVIVKAKALYYSSLWPTASTTSLYDNDGNLCKETAPCVSHSSGKFASRVVVKREDKVQGLNAP